MIRLAITLAAAVLLASCGGGGGSSGGGGGGGIGFASLPAASTLAARCIAPRMGTDPITGVADQCAQGCDPGVRARRTPKGRWQGGAGACKERAQGP